MSVCLHILSDCDTFVKTALERQDLPCTYLAHHELESVVIIIIIMLSLCGTESLT